MCIRDSIQTTETFNDNLLAYSLSGNNWLSLTIPGATLDSLKFHNTAVTYPIIDVKTTQMEKSLQISFLLKIIPEDITISSKNKTINMGLFVEQKTTALKIKDEKTNHTFSIGSGNTIRTQELWTQ